MDQLVEQPVDQPVEQLVEQSVGQSVEQSMERSQGYNGRLVPQLRPVRHNKIRPKNTDKPIIVAHVAEDTVKMGGGGAAMVSQTRNLSSCSWVFNEDA